MPRSVEALVQRHERAALLRAVSASTRASPPVPTTSTGRGRASGPEPSRNTPRDSATSGSRYRTPPGGSPSSTAADVGAGQQAGDGDVPAEEPVGDGQRPHRPARRLRQRRQHRLQHPGAVLPGQQRHLAPARRSLSDTRPSERAPDRQADAPPLPARRPVSVGRSAIDPLEEPAPAAMRLPPPAADRPGPPPPRPGRSGPCRCRSRAAGTPRTPRPPGTAGRPSGSTRRRRRPSAGRARRRTPPATGRSTSSTASASPGAWTRMSGSVLWALTPSGTTPTLASSGNRSSTPRKCRRAPAPSLTPGQTTTWPWTSTPASSSSRSHRRLVAPRRLRSSRVRSSGSVAWMLTYSGPRPFVDHPFQIGLGEAGQRCEVSVEK